MSKKKAIRIIKWALSLYAVIGIVLFFTQKLFLFQGKKLPANYYYTFQDQPFKEHNIKRADGTNLNFLCFLPKDTTDFAGVVVYYHGNKTNITRYAPFARRFTDNGFMVYMLDYPGFGKSTGPITEAILKHDATVVFDSAKKQHPKVPFLVYGKSMGTGLASYIAAQKNIESLVLETPYYSLPTIYDNFTFIYPTRWLLQFQFNNYEALPNVKTPITIFHGTADGLIKIGNASKLKKHLKPNDEFVTIPGGKHNNIAEYSIYTEKLDSVLGSIIKN